MTFKEWKKDATVKASYEYGFLGRNQRDVYDMLGHEIFVETTFPHSCFKPVMVHTKAVGFNIKENSMEMAVANRHGATWEEGYYAEEGYGWPVWEGDNGQRLCFCFLKEYNKMKG
jgi:hypothetical protein